MAATTSLSEQDYRELALNDPGHRWELWNGVLVEKPDMSMFHADVAAYLGAMLINQLDRRAYRVNINDGKARLTAQTYYIPDVVVIPANYKTPYERDPRSLNAYSAPLPLVVEVWSRTTGDYDVAAKLPAYRARGDLEIWFIHPYERTLTAWRCGPNGIYSEDLYRSGIIPVDSLPGVSIDLEELLGD